MTKVPCPALTRMKREHPSNRDKAMPHCAPEGQQQSQALRLLHLSAAVRQRAVYWAMFGFVLSGFLLSRASGEELVLYGAGSLREVMTQIAADYQRTRVPTRGPTQTWQFRDPRSKGPADCRRLPAHCRER